MKSYALSLTLLSLFAACTAQDAGGKAMDRLMAMKLASRETLRANRAAAGGSDSARRVVGKIPCVNGFAGCVPSGTTVRGEADLGCLSRVYPCKVGFWPFLGWVGD